MAFEYTRYMICQGIWLWYWSLSVGCKSQGKIGSKWTSSAEVWWGQVTGTYECDNEPSGSI